jgi:hypothetical protein
MTQRDDETRPDPLEEQVLAIMALPEAEREPALAALMAAHPGDAEVIAVLARRDAQHAEHSTVGSVAQHVPPRFTRLGPYRVVGDKRLGSGAMGIVYLGEENDDAGDATPRRVALKILGSGTSSSEVDARFRREMLILSALRHPGIAGFVAHGIEPDGQLMVPWYAMELVEGGLPLHEYARRHDLAQDQRLALFESLCTTVAYLHSEAVVHRDLKPSNVLVSAAGEVKVIDFGIARVVGDALRLTQTQQSIGTPRYMAPEQKTSGRADPRSDVWALGVMLCELLWGEDAYDAQAQRARLQPAMTQDLHAIVACCLMRTPGRRYANAGALAADLAAVRQGRRPQVLVWRRWRRVGVAAGAVAAVVGLTVAAPAVAGWFSLAAAMRGVSKNLQDGRYDEVVAQVRPLAERSFAARLAHTIAVGNAVATVQLPRAAYRLRRVVGIGRAMLLTTAGEAVECDLHDGAMFPPAFDVPPALTGLDQTHTGHLLAVGMRNGEVSLLARTGTRWKVSVAPAADNQPRPIAVALDHRGRFVVAVEENGALSLLSGADGRVLATAEDGLGRPTDLALSADGAFLAVAYGSGMVGMHHITEGKSWASEVHLRAGSRKALDQLQPLASVALDATGSRLLVAGRGGRVVGFARSETKDWSEPMEFAGLVGDAQVAVFRYDGELVAAMARNTRAYVWRWQDRSAVATSPPVASGTPTDLAFVGEDTLLWLDGSERAHVWRPPALLGARMPGHAVTVWRARPSPDGKLIASVGNDERVCLWDAQARRGLYTFRGHSDRVLDVAWSPDGKTLATASSDHTIRVWDVPSRTPAHVLRGHSDEVMGLLHRGGDDLVSVSVDGTVRAWNTRTAAGQVLYDLQKKLFAVARDGDDMWVGCKDGTVFLCRAGRADVLGKVEGIVRAFAFDRPRQRLLVGSEKGGFVLDLASGVVRRVHDGPVWSLGAAPASGEFVCGDESGMVHVWLGDGTPLLRWIAPERSPVMHAHPKETGLLIATASGVVIDYDTMAVCGESEFAALSQAWRKLGVLSADVVQAAMASDELAPALRDALVRRLRFEGDDPDTMANDARDLCLPPRQPAAVYDIALRKLTYAEQHINPKRKGPFFPVSRALALVRLGRAQEALAALTEFTASSDSKPNKPATLLAAFARTVAHHQLGEHAAAQEAATQFRALCNSPHWREHAGMRALADELNALLPPR